MAKPARRHTTESNTYRFFVDPATITDATVVLDDASIVHQISAVLRLRAGEQVLLLDNAGWQYIVTLSSVERKRITGNIERKEPAPNEPRTTLMLCLALMRAERFEWALQKGTEIGVAAFVPLLTARTDVADAQDLSERKAERWQRIVREAAEQSRRGRVPHIHAPRTLEQICAQTNPHALNVLLWEGNGVPSLRATLRQTAISTHQLPATVISGPAGGLTEGELEQTRSCGIIAVTLGPRTLRAETAPLVAAAAIFYESGDLD